LLTVPLLDLSDQPEGAREQEVQRLAEAEAGRPFDLAQLPLLRVVVLRLAGRACSSFYCAPHSLMAGQSGIIRELNALYTFVDDQQRDCPRCGCSMVTSLTGNSHWWR
jgi:hypothetical protein